MKKLGLFLTLIIITVIILIATPAPLHMDVASAVVGTTNLTVAACRTDVWGEQCSVAVPFALTRPANPSAVSLPRLAP